MALAEHDIQSAFIAWCRFWSQRPGYEDLAWIFAVPNGGQRSKATAGRLKAEGVVAGIADVLWLRPGGRLVDGGWRDAFYLALEFKTDGGRQSPEQRAFAEWAGRRDGAYHIVRGAGAAAVTVCEYAGWDEPHFPIYADACELARRDGGGR